MMGLAKQRKILVSNAQPNRSADEITPPPPGGANKYGGRGRIIMLSAMFLILAVLRIFWTRTAFIVIAPPPPGNMTAANQRTQMPSLDVDVAPSAWDGVKIPFYMYPTILSDWEKHCPRGDGVQDKAVEPQWIDQLRNSPWRVHRPRKALLFVIPLYLNGISYGKCKDVKQLGRRTVNTLKASKYFRRHGGLDHAFMSTYFRNSKLLRHLLPALYKLLRKVIVIDRLDNTHWSQLDRRRCMVNVMHNGGELTADTLSIPKSPKCRLFFAGKVDKREMYRWRRAVFNAPSLGANSMLYATPCKENTVRRCDANRTNACCSDERKSKAHFLEEMRACKWSIFIRGDDAGSSRFPRSIGALVPSVVVSPGVEHYLSFQCIVPWNNIAVFTDADALLQNATQEIDAALSSFDQDESKRLELVRNLKRWAPHVVWSHPRSTAAGNALVDTVRRCFTAKRMGPTFDLSRVPDIPCPLIPEGDKFQAFYSQHVTR